MMLSLVDITRSGAGRGAKTMVLQRFLSYSTVNTAASDGDDGPFESRMMVEKLEWCTF